MSSLDERRYLVAVRLNSAERDALRRIADEEHLPAVQVIRRLIWQAAPKEESKAKPLQVRHAAL